MVKRFLVSGRTGFYLGVTREGHVGAGDPVELVDRGSAAVRISDITGLYVAKSYGPAEVALVQRALTVASLPDSWKEHLRKRL
jgi:MOSC domain-containing protein YiiM